ncbi:MAG: hypothetical protein LLG42_13850 [Chloroflexi bacterium]|nr:hypothetical protein [Chloroflexota bacterium]
MMSERLEKQKSTLRDLLYFVCGAAVVLLLTSMDLGNLWDSSGGYSGRMISITAWFAPWLILQIVSLIIPVWMCEQKEWRKIPFDEKANLFFGYLAVCWVCAAGFVLRVSDLLNYSHLILAVFGAVILAGYLFFRFQRNKQQDMFP